MMITWFLNNMGTILVLAVLAIIVACIVINMRKNKKAGKSSCGCGCSSCALHEQGCCGGDKK